MSRRRIAFASIAVVTVLCLVGVSVLAVAAGGSALAYEVNGTRVPQETVDGQLRELAHNDTTKDQAVVARGGRRGRLEVGGQVMTLNVARQVMRDVAAKRGPR